MKLEPKCCDIDENQRNTACLSRNDGYTCRTNSPALTPRNQTNDLELNKVEILVPRWSNYEDGKYPLRIKGLGNRAWRINAGNTILYISGTWPYATTLSKDITGIPITLDPLEPLLNFLPCLGRSKFFHPLVIDPLRRRSNALANPAAATHI